MTKLTKNFNLSEFECNCGCEMPEEVRLNIKIVAKNLQEIRDCVEEPIKITNAYRCEEHNHRIGSKNTSQHVKGLAADIKVKNQIPVETYETVEALMDLEYINKGGLGLYNTFVHVDFRGSTARWDNR